MDSSRPHLFGVLAGVFLAAGIAFASLVLAGAWTRISESQLISVTGSARRSVRSDLVIWRSSYQVEAPTLLAAHQRLREDFAKVQRFLTERSLREVAVGPVQIREVTERVTLRDGAESTTRRVGYRLSQVVEVRSPEVDRVPGLATESAELLEQGVTFVSDSMEFIYTKAGEAKVEMMAEATKDARARANQIAENGGRTIRGLREARMGVIQINPLHSTATSWEGNNDTTALEKTITATVSASFSLR
jgi:hypothetical protein